MRAEEFEKDIIDPIPDHLCCPITAELMIDPVIVAGSKMTYERAAIEKWLGINNTDPLTNVKLETNESKKLFPNEEIKNAINQYKNEQKLKSKGLCTLPKITLEFKQRHAQIYGNQKIRLAWDCDPGNDDFTTFASGAGKNNIEFIMISASAGNVNQTLTLNNTLFMVEKAGLNTPVYMGASHPIGVPEKEMHSAPAAHGSSGLGSLLSAELIASEITAKPQKISAIEKFSELLRFERKPFTLLMTGALTTLVRSIFELQRNLEKEIKDETAGSLVRNQLISEIFGAKDRNDLSLSQAARDILNGKVSLSALITNKTRQFLQKRINEGTLQSMVIMGGVFPETQKSITDAKLDYDIHNIGPIGIYRHSPQEIHEPDYKPQYASPSNGLIPEYGWHANQPIFQKDGITPLKPHEKISEFNFAHDPVATQMVFSLFRELEENRKANDRSFFISLVPLNTSHKILAGEFNVAVPLLKSDKKMREAMNLNMVYPNHNPSFAQWTAKVLGGTGDPYVRRTGYFIANDGARYKRQMIHDALTVGALGRPELFTYAQVNVVIDNPENVHYPSNIGRSSIVKDANFQGNVLILDVPYERRKLVVDDLVVSTLAASRRVLIKACQTYSLQNQNKKSSASNDNDRQSFFCEARRAHQRNSDDASESVIADISGNAEKKPDESMQQKF